MSKIKIKAIPGAKYGKLTVVKEQEPLTAEHFVKVRCDCGNVKVVRYGNLQNGTTKSCGCLVHDTLVSRNLKHGHAYRKTGLERLYKIWAAMLNRCFNKNNRAYSRYGGRGISVCEEWRNNYSSFRKWALENGYSDDLTIDRIDNDKGYSPDNCRWADRIVQQNNRSFNHIVTYRGESHTFAEWERITGIQQEKIRHRLAKGLPLEQVFFDGDLRLKSCRKEFGK